LNPQTKDNLRCLAAVVFLLVASVGEFAAQSTWFPSLPGWVPIALFVALLPVTLYTFNSRQAVQRDRVDFDNALITRTLPDGTTEAVRWDDLQEVGIVTTDEGPAVEDVYWMLMGTNGGCAVSGGAQGMKDLLTRLQQLPGFDNGVVIKAMGSTRNDKFLCWKRSSENRT
jgi:YD repeat-containing protein